MGEVEKLPERGAVKSRRQSAKYYRCIHRSGMPLIDGTHMRYNEIRRLPLKVAKSQWPRLEVVNAREAMGHTDIDS